MSSANLFANTPLAIGLSNDSKCPMFELRAGPFIADELRVVSFRGTEWISRTFSFDIVVAVKDLDPASVESAILDKPATLSMLVSQEASRLWRGVIGTVQSEGAFLHDRYALRVNVVPRLWSLKKRRTSRIFQELTIIDVINTVLDEAGLTYQWKLTGRYSVRSYCVQYQETDFEFVSRLCAEEGIFYYFDHASSLADRVTSIAGAAGADVTSAVNASTGAAEDIVFSDTADFYPGITGNSRLVYRASAASTGMPPTEDQVYHFTWRRSVRPAAVLLRDYDFHRPLLDLSATADVPSLPLPTAIVATSVNPAGAELHASSGIALAPPAAIQQRARIYDHHGRFEETDVEVRAAQVHLEQHRSRANVGRGASYCRRLAPAFRFHLEDHPVGALNCEYAVIRVDHEGYAPEVVPAGRPLYENHFKCVPAGVPFRPPRPTHRVTQVVETAFVVGPSAQEIHTDALGRIKVQFHWDLEGNRNEHSSCWMRVAQAWAGSAYGIQFIPRVGMEVLVTFLGGDVDRPIVTGAVYNAVYTPPFVLPEDKTRSGIKTQTSPGGGGYNELLFEDKKGGELLSLRAQRNLSETALNDRLVSVGGNQDTKVAGNRDVEVQGDDELVVKGGQTTAVTGDASTTIGGRGTGAYAGDRQVSVAGDDTVEVGGGLTVIVARSARTVIGQKPGDGHGLVLVNGGYRIAASTQVDIAATRGIKLMCGDSSIELLPDEIKLKAPKVTLGAAQALAVDGGKENQLRMGETIELVGKEIKLFSKDASIVMDEDAKINGKLVKLNCDRPTPKANDQDDGPPERATITFKLEPHFRTSEAGPLTLVIATPSGEIIERQTDTNDEVTIEAYKGDHFVLLDVRKGSQSLSKKSSG